MATRLATNLKDDYLSCRICLGQFQNPRSLSCDHSFCEKCLVNHVTQTASRRHGRVVITCPLCRQEAAITNDASFDARKWVSELPEDSLVCSLMQTIEIHEGDFARRVGTTTRICSNHVGRVRDAYCFTHAQLICWECAAREHRPCTVESAGKAISAVRSNIVALKSEVNKQLNKARSLCKSDQTFTDSKKRTLNDLSDLEERLDSMYSSAKRQITIMRSEVDHHNREHLDHRKTFYDQVSILLELNCLLENFRDQDPVNALAEIETMNRDLESVKRDLHQPEDLDADGVQQIKFVVDKGASDFLRTYSSVGFLDTVTESPLNSARNNTGAPKSLSHILNRGTLTERSLNDV